MSAGDFGNEPDATSISDRGLFRLLAGNLSPGVFRLLQHNLPLADICSAAKTHLLFDHLVRELLDRQRHLKAKRLGGLQIDDKFEFG